MDLICPLCRQRLSSAEKRWYCDNNHSFDIAKQGYTNLLPVQNKKSLHPGDNADMVAARYRFLNAGYYRSISEHINTTVVNFLAEKNLSTAAIVDAGCGEGYYSSQLSNALKEQSINVEMIGVDISKFATLTAAKGDKSIGWYVANSNNIPINDHSADVLISLFAPLADKEFNRCLKPGGLLLVATTGADHLIELRRHLYEDINEKVFNPVSSLEGNFQRQQQQLINEEIVLSDNQTIRDLLSMTPHYWRASPSKKQIINELEQLTLSIDIQLHSFITQTSEQPC